MNIHEITKGLQEKLRNEALRLRPVDDEELKNVVTDYHFLQEPYIEKIPYYQVSETSLEQMAEGNQDNRLLEPETVTLFADYFECGADTVKLYEHQESAIKSINEGKNVIICTGTGSGKTESFLIPIVNAIIKERKNPNYRPGVRALLLYPMNALVNDQLNRIRKLLKGSNVTYGRYTSELQERDSSSLPYVYENNGINNEARQAQARERTQIRNEIARQFANLRLTYNDEVNNASLTDEEIPENEYTDRRRWVQDGPADILITNYAMLEQLLLNPEKRGIFSNTWKFIVLDEAHSYDGGLGTDIAWLLRRVKHATNANRIQCIATTATLLDAPGTSDAWKINEIQTKFASPLFSAAAETFVVNLGTLYKKELENYGSEDLDYRGLITSEVDLGEVPAPEIKQIQFSPPESHKLLEYTQWLSHQSKMRKLIEKFRPAQNMCLGDAVYMSKILSILKPDLELEICENPLFQHVGRVLCIQGVDANSLIKSVTGMESRRELDNLTKTLKAFNNNADPIKIECKYLFAFASVAKRIFDSQNNEAPLARVPITWTENTWGNLESLMQERDSLVEHISAREERLTENWRAFTGEQEETYEECVTKYLERAPHVARLQAEFRENKNNPEGLRREALVEKVFGQSDDQAKEKFEALISLLALSKHPELNKPLMDLRYHQIVSGISEMAVSFHVNENTIEPHYHPNDSRVADEKNNILYTFGVCYSCFHPFILGYSNVFDESKSGTLVRYADDNHACFYAFSWIPKNNEEKPGYALNIKNGSIRIINDGVVNADELALYCFAVPSENTCIDQCPVCESRKDSNQTAEFGIIAPYASGVDAMRSTTLHYLVQHADPQSGMGETLSEGRKVLAFSDSRLGAARLAIAFDTQIEQRMLERAVYDGLNSSSQHQYNNLDKIKQDLPHLNRSNAFNWTNQQLRQAGAYARCVGDMDGFEYSTSLQCAIPFIERNVSNANAQRMLDKAYKYVEVNNNGNNRNIELFYDDYAATSLLALSALRYANPSSLVNSGYVDVYFNHDSEDEYDSVLTNHFNGERDIFSSFECNVAKRLFLRRKLYCNDHDKKQGAHYNNDVDCALLGFNGYAGIEVQGLPTREAALSATKLWEITREALTQVYNPDDVTINAIKNALAAYWEALKNDGVLVENGNNYELNLSRLRFRGTSKEYKNQYDKYFRIEEHTAQLSKETAALNQRLFAGGKINILSCSTTFEMGVDLGDLNCVFMNNLPPMVSNYKQRAGRAGRRPGSASYVLTLIGESPHDLYYKSRPYELFFGTMKMPTLYLDNPTFKAKHFRAVALGDFLSFLSQQPEGIRWKKSGSFFMELNDSDTPIQREVPILPQPERNGSLLATWVQQRKQEVQEACKRINNNEEIPYSVAEDLAYQLCNMPVSEEYKAYFKNSSELLSGPRISISEDNPGIPLRERYKGRYDSLRNEMLSKSVKKMISRETFSELADNRVLPRYGFACGNISLIPHPYDSFGRYVKLERPKSSGIFEYAPGQQVVAHKRCFKSAKPLFSMNSQHYHANAQQNRFLHWCKHCKAFFVADQSVTICPMCQNNGASPIDAIEPDAFVAAKNSEKATPACFKKAAAKYCVYSGGEILNQQLMIGNMVSVPSDNRALLFVNNNAYTDENNATHALIYEAQTDIVLWKLSNQNELLQNTWDEARMRNAWESALQAVLSAISKVVNISSRDIDGLIMKRENDYRFVLYDNSASGNGALLGLMPSADEGRNTIAKETTRAVLKTAIKICEECPNCKLEEANRDKKPGTPQECHSSPEQYRPRQACYHCIMRYENQNKHSKLDVHDAAVILNAMLGNQPIGPKTDDGNSRQGSGTEGNGGIKVDGHIAAKKTIDDDMIKDIKFGKYDDKDFMVRVDGNAIRLTLLYAIDEDDACAFINEEGEEFILAFDDIIETIN